MFRINFELMRRNYGRFGVRYEKKNKTTPVTCLSIFIDGTFSKAGQERTEFEV